jgi:hypothetical protein
MGTEDGGLKRIGDIHPISVPPAARKIVFESLGLAEEDASERTHIHPTYLYELYQQTIGSSDSPLVNKLLSPPKKTSKKSRSEMKEFAEYLESPEFEDLMGRVDEEAQTIYLGGVSIEIDSYVTDVPENILYSFLIAIKSFPREVYERVISGASEYEKPLRIFYGTWAGFASYLGVNIKGSGMGAYESIRNVLFINSDLPEGYDPAMKAIDAMMHEFSHAVDDHLNTEDRDCVFDDGCYVRKDGQWMGSESMDQDVFEEACKAEGLDKFSGKYFSGYCEFFIRGFYEGVAGILEQYVKIDSGVADYTKVEAELDKHPILQIARDLLEGYPSIPQNLIPKTE